MMQNANNLIKEKIKSNLKLIQRSGLQTTYRYLIQYSKTPDSPGPSIYQASILSPQNKVHV